MSWSWIFLLAAGAVVGAAAVSLVLVSRERRHRVRVNRLMSRLSELERLGFSLTPPAVETPSEEPPLNQTSQEVPRGWLSTVVSSLMRQVDMEPSGPQRLDLRAVAYVYEHIEENISVLTMATDLCASSRTLQRQLSKDLGCSPTDLIVAVKMRTAKQLLQESGTAVKNVAHSVGYDDPFHFSRRFKAYYGVPPSKISS